jgi:hypothetical protein
MVNPETGKVKLILMTEEYCHRFENCAQNCLGRRTKRKLGVLRLNSNFVFDRANGFGRDGDKLDAHPYALEAIPDFASSLDLDSGSRKPEAQFQDRAFGILRSRVDEHAVRAKVRRPDANVFLEAFVDRPPLRIHFELEFYAARLMGIRSVNRMA